MVYGAALEMRFGGNSIVGSNPTLSATLYKTVLRYQALISYRRVRLFNAQVVHWDWQGGRLHGAALRRTDYDDLPASWTGIERPNNSCGITFD